MPALLTSAPSVPNLSAASNSARISLSLATSHFTAIALPFLASMAETTSSRRGLIAGVADDDPKAARSGGKRGGAADAAASAGDDGNLVGQCLSPTIHIYWKSRASIATSAKIETNHTRLRAYGIWMKYSGT